MKRINLQLFAESEGATQSEGQTEEETTNIEESKELTLEEVQKLIQSETDKIRTDYSKKLKDKDKELEELQKSKMTEEEKAKFELEKLQSDLTEKEKAIQIRELTIKTVDLLKENDIPLDFREFLIGKDEESTVEKIRSFKDLWDKEIHKSVEERFKSGGREIVKSNNQSNLTREEFKKMSYKERVQLANTNPEIYKQLSI